MSRSRFDIVCSRALTGAVATTHAGPGSNSNLYIGFVIGAGIAAPITIFTEMKDANIHDNFIQFFIMKK